jgi:hypothetical protein
MAVPMIGELPKSIDQKPLFSSLPRHSPSLCLAVMLPPLHLG